MVAFRLAYHCLSSTLILSLIGLTFLLIPISLRAQSEFPIDGRMSVCLDPPDPPSMVRSDGEKQNFQDCRRWSDYTETYSFIDQKKFTTAPCDPKIPPVNLFAWHLLKIWGKAPELGAPSTLALYDRPGEYDLTEVRPEESRSGSLVVWKESKTRSGMVAFVLEDRSAGAGDRYRLNLLRVIYPSNYRCGTLISVDAATLKTWTKAADEPKFLRPKYPRLYWNHWIRGNYSEEPLDVVTVGETYQYIVDVSPFQYPKLVKDPMTVTVAPQRHSINTRVKIRFYPITKFNNPVPFEYDARVTSRQRNLTSSQVKPRSYFEASQAYGTLQTVTNESSAAFYDFQVSEPGCHQMIVLVTDESTSKVVGAWVKQFMAYSSDSDASTQVTVPECSEESGGTHLFNATIPTYYTTSNQNLRARITYLDIADRTLGYYQDFRYDGPSTYTYAWLLQSGLKKRLSSLTDDVDSRIQSQDFRLETEGESLQKLLFTCQGRPDAACPGNLAWLALQEIALQEMSSPATVEVIFRDMKNSSYFIPFHLLSVQGTMLGSKPVFISLCRCRLLLIRRTLALQIGMLLLF